MERAHRVPREGTITRPVAGDEEYVTETRVPWIAELKVGTIDRLRAHARNHPLVREVEAGTLPLYKLRKMLADLLWSINRFPQTMAALAARAPQYDHPARRALLWNAYVEMEHPALLARVVDALGGDAEAILSGPEGAYTPLRSAWAMRYWQEVNVLCRPWIVAVAAVAVGIEAVVPAYLGPIGEALRSHYGLDDHTLEWFRIHAGEVEGEHGNEGLALLATYVHPEDRETVRACTYAVEQTATLLAVDNLDAYYAYEE